MYLLKKSNLLIHSSLDEKIDKLKGKDKGSTNKSNKNLLNAINSQLFDKFQINPFQNSVPMQPMQHFQPMGPTHQLNNSIGYMPTQFVNPQPTMPMNYHSPYIANSSASAKRNRRESKEESEEITHFSGDEIDLKLNAAASAKKTQSKFGKENANVMKDGKEIKLTEQKRVNTNKVMKELNENLEDFHFEFSRQISKTSFKERKLKESTRKDQC